MEVYLHSSVCDVCWWVTAIPRSRLHSDIRHYPVLFEMYAKLQMTPSW